VFPAAAVYTGCIYTYVYVYIHVYANPGREEEMKKNQ